MKILTPTLILSLFTAFASLSAKSPNFIVIMADDLGYGDVGFHGSTQINTPYLDDLAASGIVFEKGYVSAPVCAPSRAGFITGRNQVSFGFDNNLAASQPGFDPEFGGLPVDVPTVPRLLQIAGYRTGLVGKWHLGEHTQFHPLNRGFDDFWGLLAGARTYYDTPQSPSRTIQSNYTDDPKITYLTDDMTREAVRFIERNKDNPFYLFLSYTAPHSPMEALDEDLALYSHIEDEGRRIYAAMVHRMDVGIGKVIKAVDDLNIRENTLVVFLSDNGGPNDQNYSINPPLNGQKGILLEGGIRVPFVISWPGTLAKGKTYPHSITSLDLAPTFLNLAGETPPENLDGTDLMPYLLADRWDQVPNPELLWRFTISASIQRGNWKLLRLPDRTPMLYNLSEDISEQQNLADRFPQKVDTLLRTLGLWDVRMPHPLFLEGAIWKERQLDLYDNDYPLTQPE